MKIVKRIAVVIVALGGVLIAGSFAIAGEALLLEASNRASVSTTPFEGTFDLSKAAGEAGDRVLKLGAYIPDRGLSLSLMLRVNDHADLPATHLVEANFESGSTFPGGKVKDLPGILMSTELLAQGAPLKGASARVVQDDFIFALGIHDQHENVELMTNRPVLQLAIIYDDGTRAVLGFELDWHDQAMLKDFFSQPFPIAPGASDERLPNSTATGKINR